MEIKNTQGLFLQKRATIVAGEDDKRSFKDLPTLKYDDDSEEKKAERRPVVMLKNRVNKLNDQRLYSNPVGAEVVYFKEAKGDKTTKK